MGTNQENGGLQWLIVCEMAQITMNFSVCWTRACFVNVIWCSLQKGFKGNVFPLNSFWEPRCHRRTHKWVQKSFKCLLSSLPSQFSKRHGWTTLRVQHCLSHTHTHTHLQKPGQLLPVNSVDIQMHKCRLARFTAPSGYWWAWGKETIYSPLLPTTGIQTLIHKAPQFQSGA